MPVQNQEILINPEMSHPCEHLKDGYACVMSMKISHNLVPMLQLMSGQ